MARPWAEVAADPNYIGLEQDARETARNAYFEQNVAPRIPPGQDAAIIRAQFDQDSREDLVLARQARGPGQPMRGAARPHPVEEQAERIQDGDRSPMRQFAGGMVGGVRSAFGSLGDSALRAASWLNQYGAGYDPSMGISFNEYREATKQNKAEFDSGLKEYLQQAAKAREDFTNRMAGGEVGEDAAWAERISRGLGESIGYMAPTLAAAILTGGGSATAQTAGAARGAWAKFAKFTLDTFKDPRAYVGATLLGTQTYNDSKTQYEGEGLSDAQATKLAFVDAAAETIPEMFALHALFGPSKSVLSRILKTALAEVPSEQVTSLVQNTTQALSKMGDTPTREQLGEAWDRGVQQTIKGAGDVATIAALQSILLGGATGAMRRQQGETWLPSRDGAQAAPPAVDAAPADVTAPAQDPLARDRAPVAAAPQEADVDADEAFSVEVDPEDAAAVESPPDQAPASEAGRPAATEEAQASHSVKRSGEAEPGAVPPEAAPGEAEAPHDIGSDEFNDEIMDSLGYTEEDKAEAWAQESARRRAAAAQADDPFSPEATQRAADIRTAIGYVAPPPPENGRGIVPDPDEFPDYASYQRAVDEIGGRIGIAGHPAWKARPNQKMKPEAGVAALQKAERGEPLTRGEQRFVDRMLEYVAEERGYERDVPETSRITDEDVKSTLMDEEGVRLAKLAQRARLLGVDEAAVENALERDTDEAALEVLNELIQKASPSEEAAAAPGEEGSADEGRQPATRADGARSGRATDLLGADAGEKGRGSRKATDYAVDTEDDGNFTVKILRNEDGSVAIFDTREGARTIEYPAAFASGKSDEELLAYSFEPIGFRSAKEAAAARPTDLFGADTERQGQINAQNAKVAKKLGQGRKPPPPGGMFAAADEKDAAAARAAQTDVEELQPEGKQTVYRGTPVGADPDQPGAAGLLFFSNTQEGAAEQGEEVNSREVDLTAENSQRYPNRAALLADNGVDPKGEGASDPSALYEAARNYFAKPDAKPWLQFGYPELDGNPQEFIHKPSAAGIDAAAHAAATSPQNDLPDPTPAQIDAGNYAKGHVRIAGLDISIENPKGSIRRSKPGAKRSWEVTMPHHYGYIRGSKGADGDHVDISLGPNADSDRHTDRVFVIDQKKIGSDAFDEHKAFIGFTTASQAQQAHVDQFDDKDIAEQIGGPPVTIRIENFRRWLAEGDTSKPIGGPIKTLELPNPRKGWRGVPTAKIRVQQIGGRWYYAAEANTSNGGFGGPLEAVGDGFATEREALDAARGRILASAEGSKEADRIRKWLNLQGPKPPKGGSDQFLSYSKFIEEATPGELAKSPGTLEQIRMDERLEEGEAERLKAAWDKKAPKPDKAKLVPRRTEGGGVAWTTEATPPIGTEAHPAIEGDPSPGPATADAVPKDGQATSVSKNTIFTEDAAAKAREVLRKKLGQINTGLDPEMMQAGITLAGYHIEKGARTFAAYSKAMIEDLGDGIRPYLRSWYEAVRWDPRAAAIAPGMTSAEDIAAESAAQINQDIENTRTEAKKPAADPAPSTSPADLILKMLRDGDATTKRNLNAIFPDLSTKQLEEAIELAIVMRAREIVASGSPQENFDALVALYGKQPNLSTRTSTSVEQQAYSTPAPLAYLASRLAGIGNRTSVLEPTAGNGMLLIEANPSKATVNELNPDRAAALARLGFTVTQEDAATAALVIGKPVDAVIANPPFGTVRGAYGRAKDFRANLPEGKWFSTNEIDHAISINALQHMRPDGRAVLIIGSVNKQATGQARSDAYNGAAKRKFFYHLYQHFNVTDHFTVAGELYAKQGASWPVDVIVIDGRGRSGRKLPAADVPRVYDSWEALRGLLAEEKVDARPDAVITDDSDTGGAIAGPDPIAVPEAAGSGRSGGAVDQPGGTSRPGAAGLEQPGAVDSGAVVDREPADGAAAAPKERAELTEQQRAAAADRARELSGGADRKAAVGAAQVKYTPASRGKPMDTLLPANMLDATAGALAALEARVGNIDEYVANQLGWTQEQLYKRLGAEQIDDVALMIDNIDRGGALVQGSQTGIGKGRTVAAAIRFALRRGLVPIFTTEKPNLYADMIRDLRAIEHDDVRVLVTNSMMTGQKAVPIGEDEILSSPRKHEKVMRDAAADGHLGDFNIIFTTYSQMQPYKGNFLSRHDMLKAIAPRALLILDESHNAGGQDAGRKRKGDDDSGSRKTGRAAFARELVSMVKGVVYSSATWAKRPEVMDLYSKTDMRLAVEDINHLAGAIERGGVPLQQAVASMLARAGQYIRHERSFEGVEYNTPIVDVDLNAAADLSRIMAAVNEFDKAKKIAVKILKEEAKAEAEAVSENNSTGQAGAVSTNFTSVMHNVINQMLLALKAQTAVDRALELRRNGKKVVLTVANTMESFIDEYATMAELKPGDAIDLTFADLMQRYLNKSREIVIKGPDGKEKDRRPLTDAELQAGGALAKFHAAEKVIQEAALIANLPSSPIDYMHQKLRDAGVKTAEITGRKLIIDYSGKQPRLWQRPPNEITPAGRGRSINGFNDGSIDMLILNQAGSTGLSLHASQDFKDQSSRWMIIVQPEANIDTHMQMLGRVHRTGQTSLPGYDQITANIPAEKRPAAVLAKKMASLNANTTAAKDSAVTSKETVDFLNVYGDEVVAQLMEDMPELHDMLGEPLKNNPDGPGLERAGAARKVTGRLPMLPIEEQEEIYDQIENGFKAALAQAEAMGENALEAKTFPLDARTKMTTELVPGQPGGSPFAEGANIELVDVKRLGKPFTSQQVKDRVVGVLNDGKPIIDGPDVSWQRIRQHGAAAVRILADDALRGAAAWRTQLEERLENDPEIERAELKGRMAKFDDQVSRFADISGRLKIGQTYQLRSGENIVYGVLVDVKRKKGVRMPIAMGSWEANFAIADASRQITLPFSKLASAQADESDGGRVAFEQMETHFFTRMPIIEMFDRGQSEARENRYIITGNMLAAVSRVRGGQIINYTASTGEVRQGILLSRDFNLDKFKGDQPVVLSPESALRFFQMAPKGILQNQTSEAVITAGQNGGINISVPKAKAVGGRYYLDKTLTAITGDFTSRGSRMRVDVPSSSALDALERLGAMGAQLLTKTYKAEATRAGGTQLAGGEQKRVDEETPKANISRGRGPAPSGRAQRDGVKGGLAIRKALDAKFGRNAMQALIDRGVLRIVAKFENLPADMRESALKEMGDSARIASAWMRPKTNTVYIVGENAAPKRAASILLHEIGEHYGLRRMLGNDAYHRLQGDVKGLRFTDPDVKAAWERVARNYKHETPGSSRFLSEVVARLADDPRVLDASWFKRAVWAVRRFLWKLGFARIDANDIRAMLASSLRRVIRESGSRATTAQGGAATAPMASIDGDRRRQIRTQEPIPGVPSRASTQAPPSEAGTITPGPGLPLDSAGNSRHPASWDAPEESKLDSVIYTLQDKHIDTKRVVSAIREFGKTISDQTDVYLREELYHGRVAGRTQDFLEGEVKPLIEAVAREGVTLDELGDYMHNRHAEEANEQVAKVNPEMQDGGSGILTADAKAYLEALSPQQRAKYERLAAMVDAITEGTRDTLVAYGLESPDTIDTWRDTYEHYVPLHREDMDNGTGIGQGYSVRGPAAQRRTGSSRRVVDIVANVIMQRERALTRGEKNRVSKALFVLAHNNPNPDFWSTKAPMVKRINPRTGLVESMVDPLWKGRDNVVVARHVLPNGTLVERAVVFSLHNDRAKRMAKSMRSLDTDQLNLALGISAIATRWIASVNTQYNPIFGAVNLIRDISEGLINLSSTEIAGKQAQVAKDVVPALRAIYQIVRGGSAKNEEMARLWKMFRDAGGPTGYRDLFRDSQERAKDLQNAMKATGQARSWQLARGAAKWLSDYNLAMENAVRLSAFKVAIESGMSTERAASLAKNLTVNFNRKGQAGQQMGALYAFFNAATQGMARVMQTLIKVDSKGRPIGMTAAGKRILAGSALLGVVQALALHLAGLDEEDPPQFVRETSLIIPIGWKKYSSIPMPLGYRAFPNTTRILTEWALGGFENTPKRVASLLGAYVDTFNPIGTSSTVSQTLSPTAARPFVDLDVDKDFAGRSISRPDHSTLNPTPGHTRARDVATPWAFGTAYILNRLTGGTDYVPGIFSPTPDQIDYLIGQGLGGVGRESSKLAATASALVTGEDLPAYRIPLVGRFYGSSTGSSAQRNRFYGILTNLNKHDNEITGLRISGDDQRADRYQADNPVSVLISQARSVDSQVRAMTRERRAMVSRGADRQEIRVLDDQIEAVLKDFNDEFARVRRGGREPR